MLEGRRSDRWLRRRDLLRIAFLAIIFLLPVVSQCRGGGRGGGGGGRGGFGRGFSVGRSVSSGRSRSATAAAAVAGGAYVLHGKVRHSATKSGYKGRSRSPASALNTKTKRGPRMTGIGLIFLILALIAICGGIYFTAWCLCAVQRNHKEGHYILEEVDDELYHKKLYSGLDTVDEAKETYVKNHLDLDDINENKHAEEAEEEKEQDPEAPPADSGATDGNGNGEAELVSPSAPDGDTSSHKSNDSPV